eukprot:TRINITY_DN4082_c0_g1_i1.p1 TRINITY_DN4082_c0_g1~~TRINITY_DN4082_c0_g1_i1.p1  ORF type:complete len:241 (+),score=31.93 TRINITY_DN4082_c0_g1_i1:74-796(+)
MCSAAAIAVVLAVLCLIFIAGTAVSPMYGLLTIYSDQCAIFRVRTTFRDFCIIRDEGAANFNYNIFNWTEIDPSIRLNGKCDCDYDSDWRDKNLFVDRGEQRKLYNITFGLLVGGFVSVFVALIIFSIFCCCPGGVMSSAGACKVIVIILSLIAVCLVAGAFAYFGIQVPKAMRDDVDPWCWFKGALKGPCDSLTGSEKFDRIEWYWTPLSWFGGALSILFLLFLSCVGCVLPIGGPVYA